MASGRRASPPEPRATRNASDKGGRREQPGDRGERARQVVERQDDPAEHQRDEEQAVGQRQRRLGPERAGHQQAEAGEGEVPSRRAATSERPARRPGRRSSRGQRRDRDEQHDLDDLDRRGRPAILAASSPPRVSGEPPSRLSTP